MQKHGGASSEMSSALASLQDALGRRVSVDSQDTDAARADKSGHRSAGDPLCVVFAESTEDVATVLRIANSSQTPVVPGVLAQDWPAGPLAHRVRLC